ncbi:MAG: hypothetical protein AAF610_02885 [Pseudomonadota bacterium]
MNNRDIPERPQPNARRRILLCISNERPHLVTHALYGLATASEPWIPHDIVAITTSRGASEIERRLVRHARLRTLCQHLRLPQTAQPKLRSVVVNDVPSRVQTAAAHRRELSDCILREVRHVTDQVDTELCVMLGAHGPALETFVAGHTLSLLARPQDRLAQAMVSDADAQSDFFYPDTMANTAGRVSVLEIPFARVERVASMRELVAQSDYGTLCHGLDGHAHLRVSHSFRGLNFRFSNAFDIRCDSSHRVPGPRIEPRAAALYALYAQRARDNAGFLRDDELLDKPEAYLSFYDACLVGGRVKSSDAAAPSLSRAALGVARSRIGRALSVLVQSGASYRDYRIHKQGGACAYGLALAPEQILFAA